MNQKKKTLENLIQKQDLLAKKQALVGFDGFIDKIKVAVDKRFGVKENFTKITHIQEFAKRISSASGKSTNIELYLQREKMGGNGPTLANAFLKTGLQTRYIGALGKPHFHSIFESFARDTHAVSIAQPGITDALEFDDGKIMLGDMNGLDAVTYENILTAIPEGHLLDMVSRSHLLAMVNWTMLPYMSKILNRFLEDILPNIPASQPRYFFFDLADPAKRSDEDLKAALALIKKFGSYGHVILGLNLKEAQRIGSFSSSDDLKKVAQSLRQSLDLQTVFIHSPKFAACATKNETHAIKVSFCTQPAITTGAGDHFNAGFCISQLIELNLLDSLTIATASATSYVTTGETPNLNTITNFIATQEG